MRPSSEFLLVVLMALSIVSVRGGDVPEWGGRASGNDKVRIAVPAPEDPRFAHLAWPKAVRTADGTIVLGYLAGRAHIGNSCPAISISTDNGKSFSPPHILREFGPGKDYADSGNMAMGLAPDGAVVVLAHGYTGNTAHYIFGWRSPDNGRTWSLVDTSRLGTDRSGSATGSIVTLPDGRMMAVGHYRPPATINAGGVWQAFSADGGRTWGPASMVTNVEVVEPVLIRQGDQLLVISRGRGEARDRQFVSLSSDWGKTWSTQLTNVKPATPHATSLAHPFAMVDPRNPAGLLAVTFERPLPGTAQLWRAGTVARKGQSIEFVHERTLVELPRIEGDPNRDYGYGWLVPLEDRRALLFYYHGQTTGACPIWVLETEI